MNKPEISVVFTSYNHKEYLRQALDSILTQSFENFELIIIDDCSTDGSQEVLKEYADKDRRIRLTLNESNSGSYVHSTNQGASLAITPYLIFAQCDDYAEPNQFEELYKAITCNNVGVAFSRSNLVDEQGKFISTDFEGRDRLFKKECKSSGLIRRENAFTSLLESCMIPNLSAAIIKREAFEQLKGLSSQYLVLADWDFWFRMTQSYDFFYIATPLNNFRQHQNTIRSTVKETRQWTERFKMYENAISIAPKREKEVINYLAQGWVFSLYSDTHWWIESRKEIMKLGNNMFDHWTLSVIKAFIKAPVLFVQHKLLKIF